MFVLKLKFKWLNFRVAFCVIILNALCINAHERKPFSRFKDSKPPLKVELTTDLNWIEKSIQRHNYYRSAHNAQPLVYNKTLSEMSQSWANYLLRKALGTLRYNDTVAYFDHPYDVMDEYDVGQNLYYIAAYYGQLPPSLAVNLWYNEIKDYDFATGLSKNTSSPDSLLGHFTQLVWNASSQMGSAYASHTLRNGQTLTFVASYYYPRGNMMMEGDFPMDLFLENVPQPITVPVSVIDKNEQAIHENIERMQLKKANLTTPGSWIAAALAKHNEFRIITGVPELLVNDELCELAQHRSLELLKRGLKEFNIHNGLPPLKRSAATVHYVFGENMMHFVTATEMTDIVDAAIPVILWRNENKFYDYKTKSTNRSLSPTAKTHHYEQVIWKSTTHMGIAFAIDKAENGQLLTYIVANYFPSGQGPKTLVEKNENIPIGENSGCGKFSLSSWILAAVVMLNFVAYYV